MRAARVLATRFGFAQVVAVHPATLAEAEAAGAAAAAHSAHTPSLTLLPRQNVAEHLAVVAKLAAANTHVTAGKEIAVPLYVAVPEDVAGELLGEVGVAPLLPHSSSSASPPSPLALAAAEASSQAHNLQAPREDAGRPFVTATLKDIARLALHSPGRRHPRLGLGPAASPSLAHSETAFGDLAAPSLPGRGGSFAEQALHESSLSPAGKLRLQKNNKPQLLHLSSPSSSPATATPAAGGTLVRQSARESLFAAARDGKPSLIFELLGSREGLSPSSPLTVDDVCAHHSDHGATPLHLLVASPACVGVPSLQGGVDGAESAAAVEAEDDESSRGHIPRPSSSPPPSTATTHTLLFSSSWRSSPALVIRQQQRLLREALTAVRALVAAGADVDAPSAIGSTPLHWAAGGGAEDAIRLLLSLGADPRAQTYTWRRQVFGKGSGRLPIHWAAESNHAGCVRVLAEACGESVLAGDERGMTPLAVAEKELAFDAADALERAERAPYVVLRVVVEASAGGKLGTTTTTTTMRETRKGLAGTVDGMAVTGKRTGAAVVVDV